MRKATPAPQRSEKRKLEAPLAQPLEKVESAGHLIYKSDAIYWCFQCGTYTQRHLRGLGKECQKRPKNMGATRRLERLKSGKYPTIAGVTEALPRRAVKQDFLLKAAPTDSERA